MKVKNISATRLELLEKLKLPSSTLNTESDIFVFNDKDKWSKCSKVFKKFHVTEGEYFSNKLYIINEEINKKDSIGMDKLVFPERLVSFSDEIVGFSMPYVNGVDLKTIFNSGEFSVSDKISYLKEIGDILEEMDKVRKYGDVSSFYLNDLHSGNFMLNLDTSSINVVDMDSAKIGNSLSMPSKYLNRRSSIKYIDKYKKTYNEVGAIYDASRDTDLYCYIMTIFEFFYGEGIDKISMGDYYTYLQYLSDIGVSKELLYKFALIYMPLDNENPYLLLDSMKEFYGKTSKYAFESARKKGFY